MIFDILYIVIYLSSFLKLPREEMKYFFVSENTNPVNQTLPLPFLRDYLQVHEVSLRTFKSPPRSRRTHVRYCSQPRRHTSPTVYWDPWVPRGVMTEGVMTEGATALVVPSSPER